MPDATIGKSRNVFGTATHAARSNGPALCRGAIPAGLLAWARNDSAAAVSDLELDEFEEFAHGYEQKRH
jgi:hypothetical protein